MELEARVGELKKQGLGLAAISYDQPQTLRTFSEAHRITFSLLSDPESAIIRRFGLLNTTVELKSPMYGIPFPGTFIVDPTGIVRLRYFEKAYQERNTAASILVRQGATPFGPSVAADTPHLTMTAAISDEQIAPGERVTIVFDVAPRRGMHVYAPGRHSYRVVSVRFTPEPWLNVHPVTYPASEIYEFKPLDERVEVYRQPFRFVQDVTILGSRDAQQLLAGRASIELRATLDYQACDDKVCYNPQSVPIAWTLPLKPLLRK